MHRLLLTIAAVGLVASALLLPTPVRAQLPTPTADQLELLKTLTPEQREDLLRQITGSSSSGGSLGGLMGGSNRDRDTGDQRSQGRDSAQDRLTDQRLLEHMEDEDDRQP